MNWTRVTKSKPPSDITVLGAWTNGHEFHVVPSTWSENERAWYGECGMDHGDVYAWIPWPMAPNPHTVSLIHRLLSKVFKRQVCDQCGASRWARQGAGSWLCSEKCRKAWDYIPF